MSWIAKIIIALHVLAVVGRVLIIGKKDRPAMTPGAAVICGLIDAGVVWYLLGHLS